MRLPSVRSPGARLVAGGCLAWSVLIAVPGMLAASALSTAATALAAASSQCEPLPSGTTPSPSPSSSSPPTELCISVQATESSIQRGQAASFTVQVSAENGPATGVSVTLTGAPQGEDPEFTSRCPGGDGSATCTIGALATAVSPAAYQMQAQIQVAAGATSVTAVTLTATADATTGPAMTELPTASQTVTVGAPTSASTPAASQSPASTPSPLAATSPAIGPVPTTPGAASSSLISPVNAASTPSAITSAGSAVDATPGSAVGTATPSAGGSSVVIRMPAATAQQIGVIVLGLVLFLAGINLTRARLAARRASGAKPARTGNSAEVRHQAGIIRKHLRLRRSRQAGQQSQQARAGTSADDTA